MSSFFVLNTLLIKFNTENPTETTIDNGKDLLYTITRDYDVKNNLTKESRDGEFAITKVLTYTADNDLENTTYTVNGQNLSYTYETDHTPDKRDSKVILPFGGAQKFVYDGLGRTREIALGENLVKNIYYAKYGDHATSRINSVWYGVNGICKENTRYTYDKAGNIETITENGKLVARYKYDGLNRLVREDNVHLGTFTYVYDTAGNILSKAIYAYTLDETLGTPTSVQEYAYKQNGWKDQLVEFNGKKCEYDVLGNPTTYLGKTLSWQGRTLTQFADTKYTYDASSVRTSKTVDGITCNYFYDGNNLVAEQRVGTATKWIYYIYGVDGIAGFKYDNKEYLYRKNIQGDITHIYTVNGELVAQYIYDAWGNCKVLTPAGKIDDNSDSIGNKNPFRYRSYYFDVDTKLYYLQTRYYDPAICRFISADSIEYLEPETLGGLNLYAYCGNNPVMRIDHQGSDWNSFWKGVGNWFKHNWDAVVGTIVSGIVIAAGVAITIFSLGSLSHLGATLIGAGVGSFLGGLESKINGGSYWAGYLGGFVSGGLASLGVSLGCPFILGTIGSFAGTLIKDAINKEDMSNWDYWLQLTANSLMAGVVNIGLYYFGAEMKILDIVGKELYAGFSVWAEFAFATLLDRSKRLIFSFIESIFNKFKFGY